MLNDSEVVGFSQSRLIHKHLINTGMMNFKAKRTPMDIAYDPSTDSEFPKNDEALKYRSTVGTLLYLALKNRPDFAMTASKLRAQVVSPTEVDMEAAKRSGTKNFILELRPGGDTQNNEYTDAD